MMTARPPDRRTTAPNDLYGLLAAIADGDRQALQSLYTETSPTLFGLAEAMTGDRDMAANALHDTFVHIWTHARLFDPHSATAWGWIIACTRYRVLDRLRNSASPIHNRPERLTGNLGEDRTASADGAAGTEALRRELEALYQCLTQLPPVQRKAILLAYTDGLSTAHLADRFNMSRYNAMMLVRNGLANLRRCLEAS